MLVILLFFLGLVIGSFLNALIWRLHSGEKISVGRSHCVHCGHSLRFRDLWPVISFILLRGKCRDCSKNISWQYPIIELVTAILFGVISYYFLGWEAINVSWQVYLKLAIYLIFTAILVVIFVYDCLYYLILDKVTIPAMIIAVIAGVVLGLPWWDMALGGLVGFGFFYLQYLVSSGRWIGGGDLRLGLLMGLMLGWKKTIVALLLAYWVGAVVSLIFLALKKKEWKSEIPFGTFLTASTLLVLFYGNWLVDWYLRFMGI